MERRAFVTYAAVSLLSVAVLGLVLVLALPSDPDRETVALTVGGGLLVLWLTLLVVAVSATRNLRRQSVANGYLASHDALTSLPNRSSFVQRVAAATTGATADRPVAIALIDVDRFKEINETLGHHNGDQLLMVLSERLKLRVREAEGDTIARLGGDEFGIILHQAEDVSGTVERMALIRNVIREPVHIDGLPLAAEVSIGFALAPIDGTDVGTLLQRADVALYAAKGQHRGVVHYRSDLDQYDSATLRLIAELDAAIADDQLVLHYQPKGDLRRRTVIAVETLVRWQHPSRGLLYPDTFLPAAEQTELIEDLTRWVLRRAVSDLPALDPSGRLAVAVNVSARSLVHVDFAKDILDVLAETRVDPSRIILELTETALVVDPVQAAWTLSELHRAGVRISIDDFGAGFTSLGYLATLPITELKIDKGFVLAMRDDERNAAIVRSVIELGHSLGFTVTAEGVETAEILADLTVLTCDTVQGYLLARPGPMSDLGERMAAATNVLQANPIRHT